MTFLSILIGRKGDTVDNTIILTRVFNLDNFYFFQKKVVIELCTFTARNLITRLELGKINSIEHKEYYFTVLSNYDGLSICAVLDDNTYPKRVLHRLLKNILFRYKSLHKNEWQNINYDLGLPFRDLCDEIKTYNSPENIDKLYKIDKDLDSCKEIMHKNIDKILERGEKIEDLVEKSKDLSKTSKDFYRTTKKFNRCCVIS